MDTVSSESAGTVGSGVAQSQSLSVDAAASSGQSSDADAYDTLYALDSFVGPSTLSVGARSSPGADALYADDSFEEFDVPESRSRTSSLCVEPADSDVRSRASSLSEQGPWTGAVPVDLSQPEPQWQPEPEPEPAPEPAAPRSPPRDPRLKLLAPSSPGGAGGSRDPRLQLFNRRQRQRRQRATPATTRAQPALMVEVVETELEPEPEPEPPEPSPTSRSGDGDGDGWGRLVEIERSLERGEWQQRLACLTELAAAAQSGRAEGTIGATLLYVVTHEVCCGMPRDGGAHSNVIKASRGRTIVRGLEQQLNDRRPVILREAAAAVGALAALCGTVQAWQLACGRMLPRLCALCTLGPRLVCAAATIAVSQVLEVTQPSASISVLTTAATTSTFHPSRRAHAFGCLGQLLRSPAWAAKPSLGKQRAAINKCLTAGLADADSKVRMAARKASSDHAVNVGVATVTSPRGMGLRAGVLRPRSAAAPATKPTAKPAAAPVVAPVAAPAAAAATTAVDGGQPDPWVEDVSPSGTVFQYHRETGEIRTKWSDAAGRGRPAAAAAAVAQQRRPSSAAPAGSAQRTRGVRQQRHSGLAGARARPLSPGSQPLFRGPPVAQPQAWTEEDTVTASMQRHQAPLPPPPAHNRSPRSPLELEQAARQRAIAVVAAEHEESAKIGAELNNIQQQISVLSPQGAGGPNPFAAEAPFATTWVDHSAEAADRLATSGGRHSAPTTDAEGGKHQAPHSRCSEETIVLSP